ncbi:MAG: hypothetical protein NC399_11365 [Muribaculum sp.]|nr:hypothetical protein [Muribaculum sp.]
MILEFMFKTFYNFFVRLLDLLGISFDFTFEIPALDTFLDVLSSAVYFFPWRYVAPILFIIIGLMGFRITVALLRFVLQFVPFIGGN